MVVRCFGSRYLTRVLMINKHQKHDAPHTRLLVTTTLQGSQPHTLCIPPAPHTRLVVTTTLQVTASHASYPPAPCAAVLMF